MFSVIEDCFASSHYNMIISFVASTHFFMASFHFIFPPSGTPSQWEPGAPGLVGGLVASYRLPSRLRWWGGSARLNDAIMNFSPGKFSYKVVTVFPQGAFALALCR